MILKNVEWIEINKNKIDMKHNSDYSVSKGDREPINSEVGRRNDKHFTAGYEWLGICGRYQL